MSGTDAMSDDEMAVALCLRMVSRRPVWVDSEMGQRVQIDMVSRDEGQLLAWDHEGNDRPVTDYLLDNPNRGKS